MVYCSVFIIYLFKCTHTFASLFGCHTCSIYSLAICFKLFFDWKTKQIIIIKSTKYPHAEKNQLRSRLIWNVIPPSICFICFYGHSTTRRYPTHPTLLYCGNTIKLFSVFYAFGAFFCLPFFWFICSALPLMLHCSVLKTFKTTFAALKIYCDRSE